MEVRDLRVAGSEVVVVSDEKIVTWNLATGNARVNINDSSRISTFANSHFQQYLICMSISPDLSRTVTLWRPTIGKIGHPGTLEIHDVSTGRYLASTGVLNSLSTFDRLKVTDI